MSKFFALAALFSLLLSCATEQPRLITARSLVIAPTEYSGKMVSVKGKLTFSPLGYPKLGTNGSSQDSSQFIDLVTKANLEIADNDCVIVEGTFQAFDSKTIGLGYLTSKVGVIDASRIEACGP